MSEELKEQIRQLLRQELKVEVYGGSSYLCVRLMLNGEQITEDEVTLVVPESRNP